MADPFDFLTSQLQPGSVANAAMPGPVPLPMPQIAQMPPDLPTEATGSDFPAVGETPALFASLLERPATAKGRGVPWADIARTLGPVIAAAAMGRGPAQTGFLQGMQSGQILWAREQDRLRKEKEEKEQRAATFRMKIFESAREITDPQEWAQFVDLATDSALQMGFIESPAEMKSFLTYPAHLETKKKREAALQRLESLMKSGYDLEDLIEQNASVQVGTGPKGSMETWKVKDLVTVAGAMPDVGGQFVSPPKRQDEPTDAFGRYLASYARAKGKTVTQLSPAEMRAAHAEFNPPTPRQAPAAGSFEDYVARYAQERGKTPETLTATDIQDARKRYNQADDKGADPLLAEMRQLRLEQMKGQPGSLPSSVQRQVDQLSRAFDNQPTVKRTQVAAEAVVFANSLDVNTKNPADDQALIYAFAKAMDPDSVVREGEYATVQKYAQSWAEQFGFDVKRMFANTHFLTPQARANMKATIQQKFSAIRGQYDNLRRSYADRINKKTKQQDGEDYLTDYGGGFPDTGGVTVQAPNGKTYTFPSKSEADRFKREAGIP